MALIQTVHVNVNSYIVPPVVHAVQNDTDRQVKVIVDDMTLTSGLTGKITFVRSDGTHYEASATLDTATNSFTADIDQALTQPGRTMVQLKVTDTLTVSTFSFAIFVEEDTSGTVTPQEGIDLVSAVSAAEDAAEKAESAAAMFDEDVEGYVDDWLAAHPEVTTTVQDHSLTYKKLVNGTLGFVTPEMYGAVGDGVTDDTNALSSCFSNSSGLVILDKTYKVTDLINIPDNTTIICSGEIKHSLTNAQSGVFVFGNNCHWYGGTFTGSGAVSSYISTKSVIYALTKSGIKLSGITINDTPYVYTICLENCNNSIVYNCEIKNYTYGGICLLNGNKNIVIESNSILYGNETGHANRYPISFSLYDGNVNPFPKAENIRVLNNYIEDFTPFWEGIDGHGGEHIIVSRNTIIGTFSGIVIGGDSSNRYNANDIVITDNIIILPTSGTQYAKTNSGVNISRVSNIVISNNEIKNAGYLGNTVSIGSSITLALAYAVQVENNKLLDCQGDVIYISGCEDIQIKNNYAVGISSMSQFFVDFTGLSDRVMISDNVIKSILRVFYGIKNANGGYRNYFIRNKIYGEWTFSEANYTIIDCLYNKGWISQFKTGEKGDIMYNVAPAVGDPIGWICTSSGTSSSDAVWTALTNL